ncbi:MAG: hypothetical protein ABI778_05960 [Ignavibacteriota bacterium]
MKHLHRTFLTAFSLVLSILATQATAQLSIEANLIMPQMPSPYLSDWQSQPDNIRLTIISNSTTIRSVKIAAQLSIGGRIMARTKVEAMPKLNLQFGLNTFNAATIIPYSAVRFTGNIEQSTERSGMLPEGNYEICISLLDGETGNSIATLPCQPFTIISVEPPVLISPSNGDQLSTRNLQSNKRSILTIEPSKSLTLQELANLNGNSLKHLRSFTLTNNGRRDIFYLDPQTTGRDSADAMQIPLQASLKSNASKSNFSSRLMEEEGIFYRFYKLPMNGNENSTKAQEAAAIRFSWLPPMPQLNSAVEYQLRIVPVYPGQSPGSVLRSATPIIEKRLSVPFYTVEYLSDEYFKLGDSGVHSNIRQFAWGIRAIDGTGNPIGKNNGWSEARSFLLGDLTVSAPNNIPANSFFDVFENIDPPATDATIKTGVTTSGQPDEQTPCPDIEKELLRTVIGSWRLKIGADGTAIDSKSTHGVSLHPTGGSWAGTDATWERDMWNVFSIKHCTLLKGHSGSHIMGKGSEVFEKSGTMTETVHYEVGEEQVPPKETLPGIPHEDPPKK